MSALIRFYQLVISNVHTIAPGLMYKYGQTLILIVLECFLLSLMILLDLSNMLNMLSMSLCILFIGRKSKSTVRDCPSGTSSPENSLQFPENIQLSMIGRITSQQYFRRYLEMRGADEGHGGGYVRCLLFGAPELQVGLLYDDISLQNVLDMTADWTQGERQMLRNKVPVTGLKTPFRVGLLKHVAEEVLQFAKDGLERRGYKETGFLNEVADVVKTGLTPAEKLLELYHGKWGQNVDPVFEELLD